MKWILLALLYLAPMAIVFGTYTAKSEEKAFYLGDTQVFRTVVCLKEEHVVGVLDVHQNIGLTAAMGLLKGYIDAGVCAVLAVEGVLIRVVKSYVDLPIPEGKITAHIVEVMVENGGMLFAIITIPVLERNQKNPT